MLQTKLFKNFIPLLVLKSSENLTQNLHRFSPSIYTNTIHSELRTIPRVISQYIGISQTFNVICLVIIQTQSRIISPNTKIFTNQFIHFRNTITISAITSLIDFVGQLISTLREVKGLLQNKLLTEHRIKTLLSFCPRRHRIRHRLNITISRIIIFLAAISFNIITNQINVFRSQSFIQIHFVLFPFFILYIYYIIIFKKNQIRVLPLEGKTLILGLR